MKNKKAIMEFNECIKSLNTNNFNSKTWKQATVNSVILIYGIKDHRVGQVDALKFSLPENFNKQVQKKLEEGKEDAKHLLEDYIKAIERNGVKKTPDYDSTLMSKSKANTRILGLLALMLPACFGLYTVGLNQGETRKTEKHILEQSNKVDSLINTLVKKLDTLSDTTNVD
jgi:hypothetical protein